MDIRAKFLEMTTKTYPIGTEKGTYKFLPQDFIKDPYDNLYWIIGRPDTLFCAHLDTVDHHNPWQQSDVTHVIDGDIVKSDGKTILGADDKAGVIIMLYMIEKQIPGFYLFTVGEEKGCSGSSKLSQKLQTKSDEKFKGIKKIVAFDRSGYGSIITHQMEQRCCSDEFADALASEFSKSGLKFTLDTGGIYCDSAEFADIIPECTNISVGYFEQHSINERQDIAFLQKLSDACCRVDWKSLPVKRDPRKVEYIDSYYYSRKKRTIEGEDETEFDDYDFHPFAVDDTKDVEVVYFDDKRYSCISDISYLNGEIVDITLSQKRVERELELITKYMEENQIAYSFAVWDGLILVVEHDKHETKISRNDLLKYIPQLDIEFIKKEAKLVKK